MKLEEGVKYPKSLKSYVLILSKEDILIFAFKMQCTVFHKHPHQTTAHCCLFLLSEIRTSRLWPHTLTCVTSPTIATTNTPHPEVK